jgi:two-component system, OmpR family, sensor histidine kinase ChvG
LNAHPRLSLRAKLLLVALPLLLLLPWTGWQLLREMEALLREGQQQALLATAEALGRALAASRGALPERGPGLFVQELPRAPALDGAVDDWAGLQRRSFAGEAGSAFDLVLGRADDTLYLLVEARLRERLPAEAHWPRAARSDHLRLDLDGAHGALAVRIANAADGPLRVAAAGGEPAPLLLQGAWRERAGNVVVEAQLPQGLWPERLGIVLQDAGEDGRLTRVGTAIDAARALWPLAWRNPRRLRAVAPLLPATLRARLLDAEGWILAEAGELPDAGPADALPWWRRALYQRLLYAGDPLAGDDADAARSTGPEVGRALSGIPDFAWRRDRDAPRLLLSAAVPLKVGDEVRGVLQLEREHQTLLLTERALGGLLGGTLLALAAAGLLLLAFASRLGWRIRRLRDDAERALQRDGRLQPMAASEAGDEIGDLSRRFARLLAEVGERQQYLRTLAGTLSHELNTPLAIVRGALDSVDAAALPAPERSSIERARGGSERLAAIVRAMGEASRIEQAIEQADVDDVDLSALIARCADGYRDLLAPRRLELALPAAPLTLHCAPELIVQALDKLVDNARGFTPGHGGVYISLAAEGAGARIAVANDGPPLPPIDPARLFESMVGARGDRRGGVHLGFGLHLVRLVAEHHGGRAVARNRGDGEGVEVEFTLQPLPRRR